jgi:hypothetical protein
MAPDDTPPGSSDSQLPTEFCACQGSPGIAESRFAVAVSLAFLLLAGAVMVYHEPWRDELQAWLIARDSTSVRDLLHHIKYDGHPALWYLALYALQRGIARTPVVMQVSNLLIAAAAVTVVARYAPFTRVQRAAFAADTFHSTNTASSPAITRYLSCSPSGRI